MTEPFTLVRSKDVYHGRVITVRVDSVMYQGKELQWEIVEQGQAVVVIPVVDKDHLVLIHQYRYTAGTYMWEFPAGRAKDDEPMELSAQRELEEECGYRAKSMKQLLTYYPSPGVCRERMHLFLAESLYEAHEAQPDDDEIIRVEIVPVTRIEEMILDGTIQDAKTILAFMYYKAYVLK